MIHDTVHGTLRTDNICDAFTAALCVQMSIGSMQPSRNMRTSKHSVNVCISISSDTE